MKLPLEIDQLPSVDLTLVEAVAVEHGKQVGYMGDTLRGYGWSPMQVAFAEDKWSWSWVARAVIGERLKRGLAPVDQAIVDRLRAEAAGAKLDAAEAAWVAEHGPTAPPRQGGDQVKTL